MSFPYSSWQFSYVNVQMINSETASLELFFKYSRNVMITNCTFGNWGFIDASSITIENCSRIGHEKPLEKPLMIFYNSSAKIQKVEVQNTDLGQDGYGLGIGYNSFVEVKESSFINNTFKLAFIRVIDGGYLNLSNSHFEKNMANENGSPIFIDSNVVHINNSYFANNQATAEGRLIYMKNNAFIWVTKYIFTETNATKGVVLCGSGQMHLNHCIFSSNRAVLNGGALAITSGSKIEIIESRFLKNFAHNLGGAVFVDNSS